MIELVRIIDLYDLAEENSVTVESYALTENESLSIKDISGDCFVAIDPMQLKNSNDERIKLSHELGHCITGAFYSRYTPLYTREMCERKANNWAIKKLVPIDELISVLKSGKVQIWELAEHFGVDENFVSEAISYYDIQNPWYDAAI